MTESEQKMLAQIRKSKNQEETLDRMYEIVTQKKSK